MAYYVYYNDNYSQNYNNNNKTTICRELILSLSWIAEKSDIAYSADVLKLCQFTPSTASKSGRNVQYECILNLAKSQLGQSLGYNFIDWVTCSLL